MEEKWLFESEHPVIPEDLVGYHYLHSEIPDLMLTIYVSQEENREHHLEYVVGFAVTPTLLDAECEVFDGITPKEDPQFDAPNDSEFVREHIEPASEKVKAFLARFPDPTERTTTQCSICGAAFNGKHLEERGEKHYQHFRDHHLGNSTVKSALKRA